MMRYVALQLGINVGKRQVRMAILKELLEKNGFSNVKTLLASGNVIFDSEEKDIKKLTNKLDALMTKEFSFTIQNIVKLFSDIQQMVDNNPFKAIEISPVIKLYVTFLAEKSNPAIPIPYESPDKNFRIIKMTDNEVFSVKVITKESGTTDAMDILSKGFGKKMTTRNWNTIVKIATTDTVTIR